MVGLSLERIDIDTPEATVGTFLWDASTLRFLNPLTRDTEEQTRPQTSCTLSQNLSQPSKAHVPKDEKD